MSSKNFSLNNPPTTGDTRYGSLATKLFKRLVIPAFLIAALAFGTSERSVVDVQAEDCTSVNMDLSACYTYCGSISDYYQRLQCYSNCEFTLALRGATCNLPSHSPMMVTGGGCDPATNGQRAYDNCIAGTLEGSWQEQFLVYMAYYNDLEISCAMIGQGVEAQGCY